MVCGPARRDDDGAMNTTATMSPRQRWLAILRRQTPDRVPTDMWATPEVQARLLRDLRCDSHEALNQRLNLDRPRIVEPHLRHHRHAQDPAFDFWGVRYRQIVYGAGQYREVECSPMAAFTSVAAVHRYPWPSPDDFDFTPVQDAAAAHDGFRILQGGMYEPFLRYGALRGLEQSYVDLLLNPDIADAILGHLFEFHFEYNRRIFEAADRRIDLICIAEDLGGQNGPLFSLDLYRRFFLPNQIRMADLARRYGVHVMYHTDGAVRAFLPDLVDKVGIEILNPIQWRCAGMDRMSLVHDFGDRLAFHGAMDNQQTLSFGLVNDVIAELRENLDIFSHARWICAPCHNLQTVTPTASIVALYEAIHNWGAAHVRK